MSSRKGLSRREREIMDILHQLGEGTVNQVMERMASPPSYSAVRTTLGLLVTKEQLKHRREGTKYIYAPRVSREVAGRGALKHLVHTFFSGSVGDTLAALLGMQSGKITSEELKRIEQLIEQNRFPRK